MGTREMTKLRLLSLAEATVLLGLGLLYGLDLLELRSLLLVFAVVTVAFFIPSLLAIRSERKGETEAS